MITYSDVANYVRENKVDGNTDIFELIRDIVNQYSPPSIPSLPLQQELIFPEDGEYTIQDTLNLFST